MFLRRFLLNANTADELDAANPSLRGFLVGQFETARPGSAELEADTLLALLDGLIYGIVTRQLDTRRAIHIMESHVERACRA